MMAVAAPLAGLSGDNITGLVLAVVLAAYLVYALVFPEKL